MDIKEALEFIYNIYPVFCNITVFVIGLTIIGIAIITIKRYHKGDEISFGKFKISSNKKLIEAEEKGRQIKAESDNSIRILKDEHKETVRQLQEEYNIILTSSKQKSILLKLFDDIHKGIGNLLTVAVDDRSQFYHLKTKLIELILAGILSPFTKYKDNIHRVALFTPDKNKQNLISKRFCGFFPGEYPNGIELPFCSVAGHVYLTGKSHLSPDVHEDPLFYKDPKHKTDYSSLLCVPIMNKECFGVLSLDGRKKNSFDKHDEKHLSYFATLIGIIMKIELFNEDIKIYEMERRSSNADSSGDHEKANRQS